MVLFAECIPNILSQEVMDIYNVERNTFLAVDTGDTSNKFEVEVGDAKQDEFYPQMKLKRWDNECNFSVRLVDDETDMPAVETGTNKIKYVKEKTEAHFYNVSKTDGMPECYEFEIILKEKPLTNLVQMSIETKRLNFYYQPELTQEEIDEGAFRPENVVGSYAVYHESKQGDYSKIGLHNYMAGKAFHIYRPKIIDSTDKEVFGDLNIDIENKLLTVTIPQEFLDNAVYPVRHAAGLTFGYESAGASSSTLGGYIYTYPFTSGGSGTLTNITFYANLVSVNNHFVIYDASNRIDYSEQLNENFGPDWKVTTAQVGATISNQEYYMGFFQASTSNAHYYDIDTGDYNEYQQVSYSTPPPANWTPSTSGQSRKFSIYCTYTAGEPPTVKPMWYYNMLRRRNQ